MNKITLKTCACGLDFGIKKQLLFSSSGQLSKSIKRDTAFQTCIVKFFLSYFNYKHSKSVSKKLVWQLERAILRFHDKESIGTNTHSLFQSILDDPPFL